MHVLIISAVPLQMFDAVFIFIFFLIRIFYVFTFFGFSIEVVFHQYGNSISITLFGLFLADGVCTGLCLQPSLCRSQSILVQNNPHHLLSPLLRFSTQYLSLYLSEFISYSVPSCFLCIF